MNICCILLAAGTSSRFGGDKLLTPLDGVPMGAYAIRLHARFPYAKKVLVTVPSRGPLIEEARAAGFTVVMNPAPEEGISSSIRLGLTALTDAMDGVLFAVCDQPRLTEETVNTLWGAFDRDPSRIVAPAWEGRRGNPVLFPAALLPELGALSGDTGGGAVIKKHPDLLVTVPVPDARELTDIDQREETLPPLNTRK